MKGVLVFAVSGLALTGIVLAIRATRKTVSLTGEFTFWTPELTTEFGEMTGREHVIFDGASTMNELHFRFHGVAHSDEPVNANFEINALINGIIVRRSNVLKLPNLTHQVINDIDAEVVIYSTDPIGAITAEAVLFNERELASVKSRQIAEVL